jgi:hypothetical protein
MSVSEMWEYIKQLGYLPARRGIVNGRYWVSLDS